MRLTIIYVDHRPLYYREANGAVLVFDITDEDSFNRVREILPIKKVVCVPFVFSGEKLGERVTTNVRQ